MESDNNPVGAANAAPRCTAKSKRTGEQCKGPAVTAWRVCRFHGAVGGHPAGKAHPSWKHGMRSKEWIEDVRSLNALMRKARKFERRVQSLQNGET